MDPHDRSEEKNRELGFLLILLLRREGDWARGWRARERARGREGDCRLDERVALREPRGVSSEMGRGNRK